MGTRGLQYQIDRFAQRTPMRPIDAYGLRHPLVNQLSFILVAAVLFFGVWASTSSMLLAAIGAAVLTPAAWLMTRRNHRRRLQNGTSAEYGTRR